MRPVMEQMVPHSMKNRNAKASRERNDRPTRTRTSARDFGLEMGITVQSDGKLDFEIMGVECEKCYAKH